MSVCKAWIVLRSVMNVKDKDTKISLCDTNSGYYWKSSKRLKDISSPHDIAEKRPYTAPPFSIT